MIGFNEEPKCSKCNKEMEYFDNSFAQSIYPKLWSYPVYYCKDCDTFYDGFIEEEGVVEEKHLDVKYKDYLKYCFSKSYLNDEMMKKGNVLKKKYGGLWSIPQDEGLKAVIEVYGEEYIKRQPKELFL